MTTSDKFAAARQRVANQVEIDTASAKADMRAEFSKVAEWMNRSLGQRVRWAMVRGGR